MKVQKLYKKYKYLQSECDKAEELMIKTNDITFGDLFDSAYEAEYKALQEVIKEVVRLTGVTYKVARKMVADPSFEKLMDREIVDDINVKGVV